jgi:glycosyltransferase involved in cell wall biosynthesis
MPKVLLLAYHYPPLGGVAVMRVLRFSRYLREYGWEPIVMCVDGGAKHEPRDQALTQEIPSDVRVIRVPCLEPDNYADTWDVPREKVVRNLFKTFDKVLFPDDRALWIKPVTKKARAVIAEENIKVVWATAQPWSTLVAGRNIKRATGVPLVLDFRDDWTTSNADFRKVKRLAREQELEQSVLSAADAVVSVTPHIVEQLKSRAPASLEEERFHYIPNGFDPAHFPDQSPRPEDEFTVVHTGGLYHLRPIEPLLEVLDAWFAIHPDRAKQVKVKLAGKATDEVKRAIESSPWSHCIQLLGFVSHGQVRDLITKATVNLLMIEQVSTAAWLFTGKVFEYIGARRPILMLGPDPSPLADLLRKTGLGRICSYQTPKETARTLESLLQENVLNKNTLCQDEVERFNAYHQTRQLADIFEEVARFEKTRQ